MTSPNADATPQSVSDKLDGINANGNQEPYDVVAMLYDANLLGLAKDYAFPEGSNTSSSALDHVNTLAKILTRTHKHADGNSYDAWDALQTCLKWVLTQNLHINDDEKDSVNYKGVK